MNLLRTLRTVTSLWKLSVCQRETFVKTFLFSKSDYLLHLQPLTVGVQNDATTLERQSAPYILGVKVTSQTTACALAISKISTMRDQQRRHLTKLVAKFKGPVISDHPTIRDSENCEILRNFDTIWPLF